MLQCPQWKLEGIPGCSILFGSRWFSRDGRSSGSVVGVGVYGFIGGLENCVEKHEV